MTIPALLKAGDAVLFGGKVVHGGAGPTTAGFHRRGHPDGTSPRLKRPPPCWIAARTGQNACSARSEDPRLPPQYPNGSPGLWQHNYADLADYLQL
ncbi:phytanoyl-CoA dioxygenase family protein [Pseudomonas aeruginosa]